MEIMPMIYNNKIILCNVSISGVYKVRKHVRSSKINSSDIIVNRMEFSKSSFKDSNDKNASIDFIRMKLLNYSRDFLVTTDSKDGYYDVYKVSPPPEKVNNSLDILYSKLITDLRKEIPDNIKRGRYIFLEEFGIDEIFTEENIRNLRKVISEDKEHSTIINELENKGLIDLIKTIDFIKAFEIEVLEDNIINENSFKDTLKALSVINTRDYKNLNRFYNIAKSNYNIYKKLTLVHNIIYQKPLPLKVKQKVKKQNEEIDYKDAS